MQAKTQKKIDLIAVCLILIVATISSLIWDLKPLIIAFLFLAIPSIYLSIREKKNWLKIIIAILTLGVMIGFLFDFIVTFNQGWIVTQTVFPWRIFGILPLDDILGWMLMTFFIVIFYEHFLDDEKNPKLSKNIFRGLSALFILATIILLIFLIEPDWLKIPYIYLVGGSIAIIMPLKFAANRPRFLVRFLKLAAFFFIIWFIIELVCLKNQGWTFPGQYIGTVNIFGLVFPFEELFFWMMFYAVTVVSFYETYIDDVK